MTSKCTLFGFWFETLATKDMKSEYKLGIRWCRELFTDNSTCFLEVGCTASIKGRNVE